MSEVDLALFREYPGPIEWNVPMLLNNDRVARDIDTVIETFFGVKAFTNIYGGFTSPWSGGRGSVYGGALEEGCVPSVGVFSARGIMSWLTFSRMELTDEQLNDERMWKIVSWLLPYKWGAIVTDDRLCDRLKEFNQNIPVKASVVKFQKAFLEDRFGSIEEEAVLYQRTLEKYDYIVARPEFIIKGGYNLIPEELRPRVEVLVNQYCVANCPRAIEHYKSIENFELTGEWNDFACIQRQNFMDCLNSCNIDYDTVCSLVKLGYKRFKIQGRGMSPRCVMQQLGEYIFEPSGFFHVLSEYIAQQVKFDQMMGKEARF